MADRVRVGGGAVAATHELTTASSATSADAELFADGGRFDVTAVAVRSLLPADSPRLDGEDSTHVRTLATSGAVLPPILVHRDTMRVIDGMHRLRVAQLRGDETIQARFFDGSEDLLFVLSVAANVVQGLSLPLADRKAAAIRIIEAHPRWSDRVIAKATGLSAKTVNGLRWCATAELPQLHTRVGRDGRVRPIDSTEGRLLASEVIAARPEASLREVARIAGISPGTVRDVRLRMARGDDPVPARQRGWAAPSPTVRAEATAEAMVAKRPSISIRDRISTLESLRKDPSLRFSETGRTLLRWLHGNAFDSEGLGNLVGEVPGHCVDKVAELARANAEAWQNFADELVRRGCTST